MQGKDPRLVFAWLVSLVATLGSLNYSGIGFLGFGGLHLFPCELCWFQRICMYPLTVVLGIAAFRGSKGSRTAAASLAGVGALLALYHSLIQLFPGFEVAQCGVGSCTRIDYRVLGLSIANQSLLAFLLVLGSLAWTWRRPRPAIPARP